MVSKELGGSGRGGLATRQLADPCIFREQGRWYAIVTSSHYPDARGVACREPDGAAFGVHSSDHLLDQPWQCCGGLLEPLDREQHWAPELVLTPDGQPYRDARGELCCFFSAGMNDEHWIYLATSPDMETRFRVRGPIVRGTDAHPHFDEAGDLCLVYVTTWDVPGACIVGTRLDTDMLPIGPVKRLILPEAPWMRTNGYRIAESPWVVRLGGRFHLLFRGGGWQSNYGMYYAVADRLLGDYAYDASRARPRLLASAPERGVIDPGHCCAIVADGEPYLAHHQWIDLACTTRVTVSGTCRRTATRCASAASGLSSAVRRTRVERGRDSA